MNTLRSLSYETPPTPSLLSQWKLYPCLDITNQEASLGKTNGTAKFKSFFQPTRTRTFFFEPFHVKFTEQSGCLSHSKNRSSSSLLITSSKDYFVDRSRFRITLRPSRSEGWSLVLKLTDQCEMEEIEQYLLRFTIITPLQDMLSYHFDDSFAEIVKTKIFDIILSNPNNKELQLFYSDTILNKPTPNQMSLVQCLYDTFYNTFANGDNQRNFELPLAVAQDQSFWEPFEEGHRETKVPDPTGTESTSIKQINNQMKEKDAEAFANLLSYAAQHEIVRAIFLYFTFADDFVDAFNAQGQTNWTGPQVLDQVLKQLVSKSKGLWGKHVQPVFIKLCQFPQDECCIDINTIKQHKPASPPVFPTGLRPVATTSLTGMKPHKPSSNHPSPHRLRRQQQRKLSIQPSAPPFDYEEEAKHNTKKSFHPTLPAIYLYDHDDACSESSQQSSSSNSTVDSLPPLVHPNNVKKIDNQSWSHISTTNGLANLREAKWYKKIKKKRGHGVALTCQTFQQLLSPDNIFIARHFVLGAVKHGRLSSGLLSNIPPQMAQKAFQVAECVKEDQDAQDASPLIAALCMHRLPSEDQQRLFLLVNEARLVNDSFFRMFLRAALCPPNPNAQETQQHAHGRVVKGKTRLIKKFMDQIFFTTGNDYNISNIRRVRFLAPILLEEVSNALTQGKLKRNDDTVCVLLEYAMRFESLPTVHPQLSKDLTLHQWIEDKGSASLGHVQMMLTSIHNRHFTKYFSNILAPNAELMHLDHTITVLEELDRDSKQRRRQHLLDALYGFLSMSLAAVCVSNKRANHHQHEHGQGETKQNNSTPGTDEIEHFLKLPKMAAFFPSFWSKGGICKSITEELLRYGVQSWYKSSILNGTLLSEPEHWRDEVIHALQETPDCLDDRQFEYLTRASIKLRQYDQLPSRLHSIEHQIDRNDESIRQLQDISMAVIARNENDFNSNLSLEELRDCANYAAAAKRIVSHQAKSSRRLQDAFDHYLGTNKPSSWLGLFKSAETIAFFIKYLERENLERAKKAFADCNKDNKDILHQLKKINKTFTSPFMSPQDFDLETGSKETVEKLLVKLEDNSGVDSISMLKNLTAAWIRDRLEVLNVPMPPRNVQSITFLLASHWLKQKVRLQDGCTTHQCSSFIAQVGTGEGKSLVIAMMACYAVKCLNKKVHILENNQGLLQRDYENFKEFYGSMDVSTSCGDYDPTVDVVYLLRREIESSYRKRVFAGHVPPFPDTVLIVDEVDELIVDGDPNSHYVKPDVQRTNGFPEAVSAITRGKSKPETIAAEVWKLAKLACSRADQKVEGLDYVIAQDTVVPLRDGRRAQLTYDWLRVLRQRIHGTDATVDSVFFVQNVSHMFSQYQAILGLSGSLGSPSERVFLKQVFRAEFVTVPSFLDTCDGVTKHHPSLVSSNNTVTNTVTIHADETQQFADAIALATGKQQTVPVIVVCENPIIATRLFLLLQQHASNCQLLLEHDGSNGRMDYSKIVDNATKPIDQDDGSKSWRVTVTDYFGGRGHDYRINDEDVDADGGLLMIALSIPCSEREFIQWKGRTARSDRQGQYAVILNAQDKPLMGNEDKWQEHRLDDAGCDTVYKESVINELLSLSDKETKKNLTKLKKQIKGGQRLNELCDQFYNVHSGGKQHGAWPIGNEQIELRDFLDKLYTPNADKHDILKFAVKVGIVKEEEEWVTKYP